MQYSEFIAQNRSIQHYSKGCFIQHSLKVSGGAKKICTCGADFVGLNPV